MKEINGFVKPNYPLVTQPNHTERFEIARMTELQDNAGFGVLLYSHIPIKSDEYGNDIIPRRFGSPANLYYYWLKIDKTGNPIVKKKIPLTKGKTKRKFKGMFCGNAERTAFIIQEPVKLLEKSLRPIELQVLNNSTGEISNKTVVEQFESSKLKENFLPEFTDWYYRYAEINENEIIFPYANRMIRVTLRF